MAARNGRRRKPRPLWFRLAWVGTGGESCSLVVGATACGDGGGGGGGDSPQLKRLLAINAGDATCGSAVGSVRLVEICMLWARAIL